MLRDPFFLQKWTSSYLILKLVKKGGSDRASLQSSGGSLGPKQSVFPPSFFASLSASCPGRQPQPNLRPCVAPFGCTVDPSSPPARPQLHQTPPPGLHVCHFFLCPPESVFKKAFGLLKNNIRVLDLAPNPLVAPYDRLLTRWRSRCSFLTKECNSSEEWIASWTISETSDSAPT